MSHLKRCGNCPRTHLCDSCEYERADQLAVAFLEAVERMIQLDGLVNADNAAKGRNKLRDKLRKQIQAALE